MRSGCIFLLAGAILTGVAAGQQSGERPRLRAVPAAGQNVKTGPEVGARIPALHLEDQNGKRQSLATLTGPKGLMLVFVRSADW
ncbi:MAG: hypothetical protein JJE04_24625 [Acidobacteriia bacterium]|nr:hypothetical protein [Terriglobia bacterium]